MLKRYARLRAGRYNLEGISMTHTIEWYSTDEDGEYTHNREVLDINELRTKLNKLLTDGQTDPTCILIEAY